MRVHRVCGMQNEQWIVRSIHQVKALASHEVGKHFTLNQTVAGNITALIKTRTRSTRSVAEVVVIACRVLTEKESQPVIVNSSLSA